jgi:hypothetical protein
MVLSFPYFPIPFGTTVKPIIPLVFIPRNGEGRYLTYGALVDSGADFTTITRAAAIDLGLVLEDEMVRTRGVGGTAEMKVTSCEIILGRGGEAYRLTIPIHVMAGKNVDLPFPLLGRKGVFERFDITFRERKLRVDLSLKDETVKRVRLPPILK